MNATCDNKPEVFHPISMFNTVGMELEFILNENKMNKDELLKLLAISNFKNKKRFTKKDLEVISSFTKMGNAITDFLLSFQETYKRKESSANKSYTQAKQNYNKLKKVVPLLYNEFVSGIDLLEDITDFFGTDSESTIFEEAKKEVALYRQTNNSTVDDINLKAWLRRGELNFNKLTLPNYNKNLLMQWVENREWENNIENIQYFKELPTKFIDLGVALVFVPCLPKTVYGAVRWIDERPLIQISDHKKDLATCWFTLFHEIGHVILHENDTIFDGDDMNEPSSRKIKKETEANKFANNYLFNGDNLRKEVFATKGKKESISSSTLSEKYNVNPLMVSFWLRRAQINPTLQRHIQIHF
jgi:Zn-dependent peptidase ImmA (M78 family)